MLQLVKRKGSPNYIMRGSIRRVRYEESTGTSDIRIAEQIKAKRESEIHQQAIYGVSATSTFGEAALSYLEKGGSKRFIAPVIRHFGTMPLALIDLAGIEQGALRLYPDVSAETRNRQFYTPAIAVLKHAAKRGWCAALVVERPKVGAPRVRYLTLDEAERLIAACSEHLRPLVIFLLYTGARIGEALWLDWRFVHLTDRHVSFPKTKNGESRGVPLHSRLVAALANIDGRTGEVFRKPDGQPYERPKRPDDTSAGTRIKTAFKAACRRAGIEDFHPHDCRHTWATWHYAVNRDLGALMRLGGWKTMSMVMRYAHVNVDELAGTIDRLPGGNLGERESARGINA